MACPRCCNCPPCPPEALLQGCRRRCRAKELLEVHKGALRPDAEAAKVPARCELQEVEAVDVNEVNARDVAERLRKRGRVIAIDDEGA